MSRFSTGRRCCRADRYLLDDLELLDRRAALLLILNQRRHLRVVLNPLDRHLSLLVLGCGLVLARRPLRALVTLELPYVLGCVWVRAVVSEHLYRVLLLLVVAHELAAGIVD